MGYPISVRYYNKIVEFKEDMKPTSHNVMYNEIVIEQNEYRTLNLMD